MRRILVWVVAGVVAIAAVAIALLSLAPTVIKIDVVEKNGKVIFTFWETRGRIPIRLAAVDSIYVASVEYASEAVAYQERSLGRREVIWWIASLGKCHGTSSCVYGEVPYGFLQKRPEKGEPPDLMPGKTYLVVCTADAPGERGGAKRFVKGAEWGQGSVAH
jgi:hypothetical protein